MRSFRLIALCLCLWAGAAGCKEGKPSDEECRKALKHIVQLTEDHAAQRGDTLETWVRNCRAFSSKDTVRCMTEAKTREDLKKCEGAATGGAPPAGDAE